jgi:hypothetical protein
MSKHKGKTSKKTAKKKTAKKSASKKKVSLSQKKVSLTKSQFSPTALVPNAVVLKASEAERQKLENIPKWQDAFANTVSQNPALLVEGSDEFDETFYLVDFRREHVGTTGLMIVNAVSGEIEEIAGLRPGSQDRALLKLYRPEEIPGYVDGKEVLMNPSRRVVLQKEHVTVLKTLFWIPCDQSSEPFLPFYLVDNVVDSSKDRVHVRVDGQIFPTITRGGKGL